MDTVQTSANRPFSSFSHSQVFCMKVTEFSVAGVEERRWLPNVLANTDSSAFIAWARPNFFLRPLLRYPLPEPHAATSATRITYPEEIRDLEFFPLIDFLNLRLNGNWCLQWHLRAKSVETSASPPATVCSRLRVEPIWPSASHKSFTVVLLVFSIRSKTTKLTSVQSTLSSTGPCDIFCYFSFRTAIL